MLNRCAVLFLAIAVCRAASIVKRQAAPKLVEFCKGSKSIVVDIDENVSGIVRSSNFSVSNYKNNSRCNVVFKTQSKPLVITIFFKSFDVEFQNTSCSSDKLCVNNVNFCGNWTTGQTFDYVVPANQTFTLNFMTNLQVSAPGFELNVTAKAYNGSTISSPRSGVGSDFSKVKFSTVNASSLSSYADKCKQVVDANLAYYLFQSPNASASPWITTTTTTARPLNTTVAATNTTTVKPLNSTTAAPSNTTTVKPANTTVAPVNTTTTVKPLNTTAAPVNTTTTVKPLNTTAAPVNTTTTVKPLNTTATPVNTTTTVKPLNTTAAPVNTTAAPVNTTTTVKPLNTTAAPVNTTTTVKPLNTTATITTAKPVNTTQAVGKRQIGLYTSRPYLVGFSNLPTVTYSTKRIYRPSFTKRPVPRVGK